MSCHVIITHGDWDHIPLTIRRGNELLRDIWYSLICAESVVGTSGFQSPSWNMLTYFLDDIFDSLPGHIPSGTCDPLLGRTRS